MLFSLAFFHQFRLYVLVMRPQFAGLGMMVLLEVAVVTPLASAAAPRPSSAAPPAAAAASAPALPICQPSESSSATDSDGGKVGYGGKSQEEP